VALTSQFSFSKIWVVESLPAGDMKTGRMLVEGPLQVAEYQHAPLQLAYLPVDDGTSFFQALEDIRIDTAKNRTRPLVQIETHGCKDGLGLADGTLVSWDELRGALVSINIASRMNLMVVASACEGIHMLKTMNDPSDTAPCFSLLGTEVKIGPQQLFDHCSEFYKVFFESIDANQALQAMNNLAAQTSVNYRFVTAESMFKRAYQYYHKNFCAGKGKKKRLDVLVAKAMTEPDIQSRGIKFARKQAKDWFKSEQPGAFDRMYRKFQALDQFPENESRFTLRYEEAIEILGSE